jgi:hypothetical protein
MSPPDVTLNPWLDQPMLKVFFLACMIVLYAEYLLFNDTVLSDTVTTTLFAVFALSAVQVC